MPQRMLADALKVTPRVVTGLVDTLVAAGLATREPHPTDRRATLVTLTSRGKALIAQLKRDHKRLARALFAPMPSREFDAFARSPTSSIGYVCTWTRGAVGPSPEPALVDSRTCSTPPCSRRLLAE